MQNHLSEKSENTKKYVNVTTGFGGGNIYKISVRGELSAQMSFALLAPTLKETPNQTPVNLACTL